MSWLGESWVQPRATASDLWEQLGFYDLMPKGQPLMLDKKYSLGPNSERLLNRVHTVGGPRLILSLLIFLQKKWLPHPSQQGPGTHR